MRSHLTASYLSNLSNTHSLNYQYHNFYTMIIGKYHNYRVSQKRQECHFKNVTLKYAFLVFKISPQRKNSNLASQILLFCIQKRLEESDTFDICNISEIYQKEKLFFLKQAQKKAHFVKQSKEATMCQNQDNILQSITMIL